LFLLKLRKDIDYVSLHLFFGDVGDGTLERWFHCNLDYIYSQGNLLRDLRDLSNNQTYPIYRLLFSSKQREKDTTTPKEYMVKLGASELAGSSQDWST
jgi:hypothetical protein